MSAPKRRLFAAVLGLCVIAFILPGLLSRRSAPRYTVTDLGVLPGDAKSRAYGINNQGQVCGFTQSLSKQACVFGSGTVTSLGSVPRGAESIARDINAQGAVTGSIGPAPTSQAFVFSRGRMQLLGTLPGFSSSEGVAINAPGEIAGRVLNPILRPGLSFDHAFLYSHGRMTDLGALLGGSDSEAHSINAAGQVAGECYPAAGRVRFAPFLYDSRTKTMTLLSMPAPDIYGYANHVNERGQAAGSVSAGGVIHAALWSGGQLTDLGAPPGYDDASAEGLNTHNEIVGRCFLEDNVVHTFLQRHAGRSNPVQRYLDRDTSGAFVYRGGKMQDLNTLISADADWALKDAHSINDRGQIAGWGLHHGQERAFLLTPR